MGALTVPTAVLGRGRAFATVARRAATADAAVTGGVALTLAALAFYARGGVAVEETTYSEVALIAAGAGLSALALAGPGRSERVAALHGGWSLALLAALTVLTALSVTWSLAPADTWLDANRMLAWLAAFAGGMALARLVPRRWAALLHGIAIGCVAICLYALATKCFPESLAENELFARLRPPFGYWNSVGLMAAMGVPPLLWLAARRSGHAAVNALAYPGLGLLLVCLMLSYSRGALLALAVGLAVWFVLVPLRLRSAAALLASGGAAALVVAWAFAQDGLTEDRLAMVQRSDAGHELALLLLVLTVVLLAAGLAVGFASTWRPPSDLVRRRIGIGLLGALAAAFCLFVATLALSEGGIDGQISKAWNNLTDPEARTPANSPSRLTATASVRARYWDEAFDVHGTSELVGAGAAAYATARKRFRESDLDVLHAHGYVVQTLADLGWLGVLVSLALLAAFLAAAVRVIGARRAELRLPWDAERIGAATLAVIVVVFGAHSFVDWTWYVPANAVAALIAAGWLVARPPLRARLGERPAPPWPLRARLRAWRPDPYRTALAAGVLIVAMTAAWTAIQPVRAVHAGDAAVGRLEKGAFAAAADIARIGADRNPLSIEPLWELAAIEAAAGKPARAEAALERAVRLQPANAEAWRRLGRYRLSALAAPQPALQAFRAAYYLDPRSPDSASDFLEVSRALAPAAATP